MIGIDEFQAALVTRLNALIASGKITPSMIVAEFNTQSRDYSYPCLRVRVGPLTTKQLAGDCQPVMVSFEIIAYSESSSSLEVSQIATRVMRALNNKRLAIGGVKSSPIRVLQSAQPIPISERGFAEHVLAECEVPSNWF